MAGREGEIADPRGLGPESLDGLLARLAPGQAELLVAYYSAAGGSNRAWRATLAESRGLSRNALRESLRRRLAESERP